MSLPAQNVAPQIVAAAGQTVFAFSWRCDDSSLVAVYVNDTLDGGFTVIRNADQTASPGGTITRASACVGGEVVTVERLSPQTQTTSLTRYGAFPADTITNVLDKAIMLSQEAAGILGKCVKVARSQLSRFSSLEITQAVAGQVLAFVADPLDATKLKFGLSDVTAYVNQQLSGFPAVQPLKWNIVGDNITLDFNLIGATVSSSDLFLVTVDGVPQDPAAYSVSLTGTPQIHFTEAPPFNALVLVRSLAYAKAVAIGDNTLVLATNTTVSRSLANRFGDAINVLDCGAKGDSDGTTGNGTNDLAAFQLAYSKLPATGGTIIIPNTGKFYRISGAGATVAVPVIAMNITKPNVHIVGLGAPQIFMDNFTKATSDAGGADVAGADIFSVFSFNSTSHGSVQGVRFTGQGDGVTAIAVGKGRAKAVGFTDCAHMRATRIMGYRIVGNVVNARGVVSCSDIVTTECYGEGCSEDNFDYMGGTFDCVFSNNVSLNSLYQGFESGTYRLTVIGNVLNGNKNGWSHVGRDATFIGNTVKLNTVTGVNFQYNSATYDASGNVVSGNVISGNLSVGILASANSHHNTIQGNRIANNGPVGFVTGEGIKIVALATDYAIHGNWIGDDQGVATQKWGVDVLGNRVSVTGNTFKGNTSLAGLTQGAVDSVVFANNVTDVSFSLSGTATNSSIRGNDGKLGPVLMTYGVTVTPNAGLGERHLLTVTDGVAWALAAPLNAVSGMLLRMRIKNSSGGVMGAVTPNAAFKMPAFVAPLNNFSREYEWEYNGANWVETFRSAADVPN